MSGGIRDIAARAGVSTATVSRLLAGKSVRPASRERVQAILDTLDYHPNLAARRLRMDGAHTIGLIVPDLTNPFFTQLVRAVEDAAWEAGLRVIACNSDEDAGREARYLAILAEEKASGLLIAPTHALYRRGAVLRFGLPTVLLDRATGEAPYDAVLLDNATAASDLVHLLLDRGRRTIAGLFSTGTTTGQERRIGYEHALAKVGLEPLATFVPHDADGRRGVIVDVLERSAHVDALVVSNAPILLEAAAHLRRRGRSASIAGFDGGPWLPLITEHVAIVRQPVRLMAETALSMLIDRIAGDRCPPRRRVFTGSVAEGTASGA